MTFERVFERVYERVVVRYQDPDGATTDVLGLLVGSSGDRLVVRPDRRPGEPEVIVDRSRVLAAKAVPPRTRRPAEVDGLERVMAEHWRAPDTAGLGGEQGWLLRAAEGFTNRANSALTTGDPGVPVEEALAAVRAWYAERGLPPQLAVPNWHDARWAALRAAGWTARAGAGAHVQLASVPALLRRPAERDATGAVQSPDLDVTWTDEPDESWLAAYHHRGTELPPVGRRLLVSAPEQGFGSVRDAGGATIAVIRVSAAAGTAGITAVEVDPAHRRRGIGSGLVVAAASWAAQRSIDRLFLQVSTENEAARRLYLRAGFIEHHRYEYVVPAR